MICESIDYCPFLLQAFALVVPQGGRTVSAGICASGCELQRPKRCKTRPLQLAHRFEVVGKRRGEARAFSEERSELQYEPPDAAESCLNMPGAGENGCVSAAVTGGVRERLFEVDCNCFTGTKVQILTPSERCTRCV